MRTEFERSCWQWQRYLQQNAFHFRENSAFFHSRWIPVFPVPVPLSGANRTTLISRLDVFESKTRSPNERPSDGRSLPVRLHGFGVYTVQQLLRSSWRRRAEYGGSRLPARRGSRYRHDVLSEMRGTSCLACDRTRNSTPADRPAGRRAPVTGPDIYRSVFAHLSRERNAAPTPAVLCCRLVACLGKPTSNKALQQELSCLFLPHPLRIRHLAHSIFERNRSDVNKDWTCKDKA